jgi:hypothetical protein
MLVSHATATNLPDALRGRLADYLDRYRLAPYPLLGAVVAFGIAFNWHWLTTAELVRILTALPCMLMMYKCLRCGISSQSDREAAPPDDTLVPRPTTITGQ